MLCTLSKLFLTVVTLSEETNVFEVLRIEVKGQVLLVIVLRIEG